MAIKKKTDMQSANSIFEGISSVWAIKDGFTWSGNGTSASPYTLDASSYTEENMIEFPVSQDSGFNFDTGEPSIEHFKVHGLNADWVSTFTPGDGELTLEIPCDDTDILKLVFGQDGLDVNVTLPSVVGANGTSATGKAFGAAQKSVYLGLFILNDTSDRLLFIKKAKFVAQVTFDASEKPLCVTLTGNIANTGNDAFGVLDIA